MRHTNKLYLMFLAVENHSKSIHGVFKVNEQQQPLTKKPYDGTKEPSE